MMIISGYDNELTAQNLNTIGNIKKRDKDRKYEWHFLYYIPNIPGICLLASEFYLLEQTYLDKAKATLQHLSQTLGIPLHSDGDRIHYHKMIKFGSTAVIQAVKHRKGESIILTSHPDKLKFDIFDSAMTWIKATKLWQQISNRFIKSRPGNPVPIMTPAQFAEKNQIKQLNFDKTFPEKGNQEMTSTHSFTKMWQETNRSTSHFQIKDSIKTSAPRGA
jgi:hypothetical protein